MSYPDFLLFIKEKKLSPKTERMAEDEKHIAAFAELLIVFIRYSACTCTGV